MLPAVLQADNKNQFLRISGVIKALIIRQIEAGIVLANINSDEKNHFKQNMGGQ